MTWGVYVDTASLAHSFDPRAKITSITVLLICAGLATKWQSLAVMAAVMAAALVVSKTPLRDALGALGPFVGLMVFIGVFEIAFGAHGAFSGNAEGFSPSILSFGPTAFLLVRFGIMLILAALLMRTTSSQQLADACMLMIRPFVRDQRKLNDLHIGLRMAFRFVPLFVDEYHRIKEAQQARMISGSNRAVADTVLGVGNTLIGLFGRAFVRADTVARALENRGYDPTVKRSCYRAYSLEARDGILMLTTVFVAALTVAIEMLA